MGGCSRQTVFATTTFPPSISTAAGLGCGSKTVKCPCSILHTKTRFPTGSLAEHDAATGAGERADARSPVVLLTGASGYVGGRLIPLLERQPVVLRCLARTPDKLRPLVQETTQVVRGDVLDAPSLDEALHGVHTAYYLVHLMSNSTDFEKEDKQAATNFAQAAKKAGVRRIIYLGGLGDDADPKLSPHLRSRHDVGKILRASGVETIEFRAGMVVGAGSISYQLMKSLTDRLPVMICPRWLTTATQPIAVDDVLAYLLAARELPAGESRIFRDRRHGGRDLRRPDPGIRPAEGAAALVDLRAGPDAVPFGTLAGARDARRLRSRSALDRGAEEPHGGPRQQAMQDFLVRPMGVKEAMRRAIAGTAE